jgi:uncharacterized membrane protein
MLVCSRCAGIYLGLLTGALLPGAGCLRPAAGWLTRHARAVAVGAALPMLLDVATQDLGLRASWHPARLVTGWLLGVGLTLVAVAHLRDWATATARGAEAE